MGALFAEEVGMIMEVDAADEKECLACFAEAVLCSCCCLLPRLLLLLTAVFAGAGAAAPVVVYASPNSPPPLLTPNSLPTL